MDNFAAPPKGKKEEEEGKEVLDDDLSKSSFDLANSATATLFFDPEHLNQLMTAVSKSKDPSKVVGTALGQILMVAYNKLNKADLGVDDRIWASDGGVIDTVLDEVVEFLAETDVQVDPNVIAQAVLDVLKDSPVAGGGEPAPQGQPAPQGAPGASMGAPPMGPQQMAQPTGGM